MPIGASKLGVLGAGLVPGGSVTFNAPGTWPIPPGVKKVSITGRGGTGNPGVAGNPGNPGNLGTGGMGGRGGNITDTGRFGGVVYSGTCGNFSSNIIGIPTANNQGQPGVSGNAGSAGSAGSAGNPGQASSGLGNNFPGGAGGNAGAAGNAGNGGTGGNLGGSPQGNTTAGGTGGNGGGDGQAGFTTNFPPGTVRKFSGAGGGGAGATNDGAQAVTVPGTWRFPGQPNVVGRGGRGGRGGNTSNYSVSIEPFSCRCCSFSPSGLCSNTTGGIGGFSSLAVLNDNNQSAGSCGGVAITSGPPSGSSGNLQLRSTPQQPSAVAPYPPANPAVQAIRSGSGGGAGRHTFPGPIGGGGGGGGGRGNAGNAGGTGGAGGTGAAGTPQTFNCVTVTPGSTTPIVVASPGGQIVISWNPQ